MPKRNGAGIALLADPTRRAIVGLIAERPRRPASVAEALGMSRSNVSRQLRLLEDGGLVVRQRWLADRRSVLFHLEPTRVRPILAWLVATGLGDPAPAPAAADLAAVDRPGPESTSATKTQSLRVRARI